MQNSHAYIRNVSFKENDGAQNTLSATLSGIILKDVLFDSNIGRTVTGGMSLMASNATLSNSLI